jgi:hypothetical protein
MSSVQDQIHAIEHKSQAAGPLPPSWWEGLCCWLTNNLRDMEMTLERRENGGDWKVECISHPLQSITTHFTANGVQVVSIIASVGGKPRTFDVAGPDSITLYRDPAGFPVKVDIRNQDVQVVMCFSGEIEPQRRQSSNAWGE